jgi:hypothetical protein
MKGHTMKLTLPILALLLASLAKAVERFRFTEG